MSALDKLRASKHEMLKKSVRRKIAHQLRNRKDLSRLIEHHRRVTNIAKTEISETYLPDLLPIERCLGDSLSSSRWNGVLFKPGLESHLEISLYVALRTIESLNTDAQQYWRLSAMPNLRGEALTKFEQARRVAWLRLAFRCALCMPLGYLVSHTTFRGPKSPAPSWSPSAEDFSDYQEKWGVPSASQSPAVLSPRNISQSVYFRLFEPVGPEPDNASLFEADFFRDKPMMNNPLNNAFTTALEHVFYDQIYYRIPYWWTLLINHHFITRDGFRPITYHLPDYEDDEDRSRQEGLGWTTPTSATKKKKLRASDAEPGPTTDEEPTAEAALVDHLVRIISEAVDDGSFTANKGGAVFQVYQGGVYVVVPRFWKDLSQRLNRPDVSPEALHQLFVDKGLLGVQTIESPETTFEIRPATANRRLGKVRSLPLSKHAVQRLFGDRRPFADNDDLHPLIASRQTTAA